MLKQEAIILARKGYYKKNVSERNFLTDTDIFSNITRIIKRFYKKGDINDKLLINNIIIAINTFSYDYTTKILIEIMDEESLSIISSVYEFLGYNYINNIQPNRIIQDLLNDFKARLNLPNVIEKYNHGTDTE